MPNIFTSESVTAGHPDKIADQISDAVLDAILAEDPDARVACEVLVNTGLVVVAGEITTETYVDIPKIAREKIIDIGYNHGDLLFDGRSCSVMNCVDEQSPDIAMGVDRDDKELGAGDQGLMFGFACRQTPEFMPLPISLAHKLAKKLETVRKSGEIDFLEPDGKTQVTFNLENGKPTTLSAVVVSSQHKPDVSQKQIEEAIMQKVITPICDEFLTPETLFHINPTGKFVIGGPHGDCGLTGRKIIVDTYGGWARHGGGAFSGKDPSKVDRSGSYMARYIAKNLVANELCDVCEVQLSYAIGVAEPVGVSVETFGTNKTDLDLEKLVREKFELTPAGIIKTLDLKRPIYSETSAYGHFGKPNLPWEKVISF